MYLPAHFQEDRIDVLYQLIRNHPLGMLVTLTAGGLEANHIPFLIDPDPAPFGTLRGHVARANPVWKEFSQDVEAMVVFQGPDAYISPSLYASKKEHGKVVPTWNYAVVHAYGPLKVQDDVQWLRAFLERLTERHEAPRATPWKVSDAPADFLQTTMRAIVGIEIPVSRLMGKWKVSQNRSKADREGVAAGLGEMPGEAAQAMAKLVGGAAEKEK
ncbi:MAG TPA: FMN-binding negative transcriptional regulator [Usitatibacteraceae bacterium]